MTKTITIEICDNTEWLCSGCEAPDTHHEEIAREYHAAAVKACEDAGHEWENAKGQRSTYHGWNGKQGCLSAGGVCTWDYDGHKGDADIPHNREVYDLLCAIDQAGQDAMAAEIARLEKADREYADQCAAEGDHETACAFRAAWGEEEAALIDIRRVLAEINPTTDTSVMTYQEAVDTLEQIALAATEQSDETLRDWLELHGVTQTTIEHSFGG